MFDAIGVSERTRKPWTVFFSFIGQLVAIGLAILVPLVGTDALPHRFFSVTLPEPPRGLHRRAARSAAKPSHVLPAQFTPKGLVLPSRIPPKAIAIQDADFMPVAGDPGVTGGFAESNGSGNALIQGLLAIPALAPPPMLAVKPPAPPAPLKRIRVGSGVQEGKLIFGPPPVYPVIARQARISGTVRLEAVISREGAILNLRAVSGHPLLIPAAVAAVQRWVFRPTYLNGEAVEVATVIDVNFMLQ